LVVVRDGSGTTSERGIIEVVDSLLPKQPTISFYGERKIRALFEEGNLFAWHLFLEAREVPGLPEPIGILGRPNSYATASDDIDGLLAILEGVLPQIAIAPQNAVFEYGILYVCARNIAMSASWHLKARPDFGRYSPFGLPGPYRFPLSREHYDVGMKCRMASTRGEEPPRVVPHVVEEATEMVSAWARSVSEMVRTLA
jgi:hypothetical protein